MNVQFDKTVPSTSPPYMPPFLTVPHSQYDTQQPVCADGEYEFFIAASGKSAGEIFPYRPPAPSLHCVFLPHVGH
jgi:hypothetical protein